ncbi:CBS domain-containing protein [Streptomyces sp. NPDC002467]|uniref:CBS domain-containing protein n=1 Tax=Streptomyces sp. NPDC002467 TaxID=3364647 RepID=UPI0036A0BD5B
MVAHPTPSSRRNSFPIPMTAVPARGFMGTRFLFGRLQSQPALLAGRGPVPRGKRRTARYRVGDGAPMTGRAAPQAVRLRHGSRSARRSRPPRRSSRGACPAAPWTESGSRQGRGPVSRRLHDPPHGRGCGGRGTEHPDGTLAEAARIMARKHVKRLPVVNGAGMPEGGVSRSDLPLMGRAVRAVEGVVEVRMELEGQPAGAS